MLKTTWFCLLASSALLSGEWIKDFATARESASVAGKDMILSFVGSDWCEECKNLEKSVLSQEEFQDALAGTFVLVSLDFPQGDPELARRNEPLRVRYGVPGYPRLVLTDSEGKPYGEVMFDATWTSQNYVENIKLQTRKKATRDESLEKAKSAGSDEEKVAALEKVLLTVPDGSRATIYQDVVEELRKLSNDKSEVVRDIVVKARAEKTREDIRSAMESRDFAGAIKLANEALALEDISLEEQQTALALRYYCQLATSEIEGAVASADELAKITPEPTMAMQARQMKQRAEAMMDRAAMAQKPGEKPADAGKMADKGTGPSGEGDVARTELVPAAPAAEAHEKAAADLKEAHEALEQATEELKKAREEVGSLEKKVSELEKAHLEAHAREQEALKQMEQPADEQQASPEETDLETIDTTDRELMERAKKLREKAREIQQETR